MPAPPVTIPAAHLDALGFEKGDPPVQSATGLPVGFKQLAILQKSPRMPLLVEESMPALLRALARQHGAKLEPGEVPQWYREDRGIWWLVWGGEHEQAFTPTAHDGWTETSVMVPALSDPLPRLESLAAVIAWQVSR